MITKEQIVKLNALIDDWTNPINDTEKVMRKICDFVDESGIKCAIQNTDDYCDNGLFLASFAYIDENGELKTRLAVHDLF